MRRAAKIALLASLVAWAAYCFTTIATKPGPPSYNSISLADPLTCDGVSAEARTCWARFEHWGKPVTHPPVIEPGWWVPPADGSRRC